MRVAARSPARFSRLVLANTVFPTADVEYEGDSYVSEGFFQWKAFNHSKFLGKPGKIGEMLSRGAAGPSAGPEGRLSPAEIAAYGEKGGGAAIKIFSIFLSFFFKHPLDDTHGDKGHLRQ